MDPEAPIRAHLEGKLQEFFSVFQEVQLKTIQGKRVRCDLLLIPRDQIVRSSIAVEIKSGEPKQPKNYRDTFLQAHDYLRAEVIDSRCSKLDISIRGALIFQPRFHWPENTKSKTVIDEKISYSLQMDGIEFVFNSFNVGIISCGRSRLVFRFGHIDIWSSSRGWRADIRNSAKWLS